MRQLRRARRPRRGRSEPEHLNRFQERELRSGRTDGEGIGEEPGEHYCIVIYGQLLRFRHKLQGILEADVGVLHVEAAGVIQFAVGQ